MLHYYNESAALSFQLRAVAVRWLEAPSPWRWPPQRARSLGGDASDASSEVLDGVEAPFGPRHAPGAALPWARPAALPAAAVTRQGTLEVRGVCHAGPQMHLHAVRDDTHPLGAPLCVAGCGRHTAGHAGGAQGHAV